MESIVFATSNPNKIKEVNELIGQDFHIIGLKEIGCEEDIPETQPTIEGNALQKAQYVLEHYQSDCFAEDTGLEVEALDGEPGVYSARFAGPQRNSQDNMNLLLQKLKGNDNRKARFKTVVALVLEGEVHTFEGIVNGRIGLEPQGDGGFGYDPLFYPEEQDITFAEMDAAAKNAISHRGRAIRKLVDFLQARSDQNLG
ncbi:MAG: non-canonical purine NTP diphosphatase [Saprospiraceae bacterium]|nr:non-canonical purine NTP diphosphatase [Saprospiraceae bacterium]